MHLKAHTSYVKSLLEKAEIKYVIITINKYQNRDLHFSMG